MDFLYKITVLIPTYNRSEALEITLRAYSQQSFLNSYFEILVIDDGSTDNTIEMLQSIVDEVPYELSWYSQENQGPGVARNWGVSKARGEIVFITGDDIVPERDLLWQHFLYHTQNPQKNVGVLGYTGWHKDLVVTPVMHYITDVGFNQFGYPLIEEKDTISHNFFYTSNISLKNEYLSDKELFRKEFVHAAFEDIELGYRLWKEHGFVLKYNKKARASHNHDITLESFCKRQYKVGEMAVVFHEMHPELNIVPADKTNLLRSTLIYELEKLKRLYHKVPNAQFEKLPVTSIPQDVLKKSWEFYRLFFHINFLLGIVDYSYRYDKRDLITNQSHEELLQIAEKWINDGEQKFREGDYDSALVFFDSVLKLNMGDIGKALNNSGVVLWQTGQREAAYDIFRHALDRNNDDILALENLCEIFKDGVGDEEEVSAIVLLFLDTHKLSNERQSYFSKFVLSMGK